MLKKSLKNNYVYPANSPNPQNEKKQKQTNNKSNKIIWKTETINYFRLKKQNIYCLICAEILTCKH